MNKELLIKIPSGIIETFVIVYGEIAEINQLLQNLLLFSWTGRIDMLEVYPLYPECVKALKSQEDVYVNDGICSSFFNNNSIMRVALTNEGN